MSIVGQRAREEGIILGRQERVEKQQERESAVKVDSKLTIR